MQLSDLLVGVLLSSSSNHSHFESHTFMARRWLRVRLPPRGTRMSPRHCEPTGPREARPDDRLREAIHRHTHRCHTPRMRGIQYAVTFRFYHCRLGILDRPPVIRPAEGRTGWRAMTTEVCCASSRCSSQ